ncbi:MAG: hypothetical protein MUE81_07170 [Thermoflexibacter sp.]|nr:hypothetical protein [Thermoflexibacter sp.]
MEEYYEIPESIECNAAEIISRKIVPKGLLKYEKIGFCFKYSCDRDSSAEIKKELSPKKAILKESSKLDLGTKLVCLKLFFLVRGKKPITADVINNSGRHKAQLIATKDFTYAEITQPFAQIANAIKKRIEEDNKEKARELLGE